MLIDLQLHSTYSDGSLTPTELVKFVAGFGIRVASLTDHNTVSGLDEFRGICRKYRIKPIDGLEIYAKLGGIYFNLLWYNFNEDAPDLHKLLRDSQMKRRAQVRRALEKLVKNGFTIDIDKIIDKYSHYIPVNQVIADIWNVKSNQTKIKRELKNKNPREEDILWSYFKNPKIVYLRESYISLERILMLHKKIGGQLILNHPAKRGFIKRDFFIRLKRLGLDGVELLSPHHSIGAIFYIQHLAREFDLITTGGSDFHCFELGKHPLQKSWDYFKIDSKYLKGIDKIIG